MDGGSGLDAFFAKFNWIFQHGTAIDEFCIQKRQTSLRQKAVALIQKANVLLSEQTKQEHKNLGNIPTNKAIFLFYLNITNEERSNLNFQPNKC